MNKIWATLKGWASDVKRDVAWGLKNPKTIRKAVVAGLTHATAMIAIFTTLFPHTSSAHAAWITALSSLLTGTVTFLTSNEVVERTGG